MIISQNDTLFGDHLILKKYAVLSKRVAMVLDGHPAIPATSN